MRCITCKRFSFKLICHHCQTHFLKPTLSMRTLPSGFRVYSFYKYSEIEELLKTKHTYIGSSIYKILASYSFKYFANNFSFPSLVYALPIDDKIKSGYSHTAILANQIKSKSIKVKYSKLRATNDLSYSGKSLDYRLKNPRNFKYKFKKDVDIILIDDIVTSGTTINEAKNTILKNGSQPLFAITLADAKI